MSEAFDELVEAMGEAVTEIELGSGFDNAIDLHRTVMEVEMAHNLHRDYEKGGDQLSDALRAAIERGRGVPAVEYMRAVAASATLNAALERRIQRVRRADHAGRAGRGAAWASSRPAIRRSARPGHISARPP